MKDTFAIMIRVLSFASIILCLSSIHSEAFAFVVDVHNMPRRRRSLYHRPLLLKQHNTQAQEVSGASSYYYDHRRCHSSSPYCHHATCCCLCASSKPNNYSNDEKVVTNDDDSFIAPHYTSKSVLSWLRNMADSYRIERGEDLLNVIIRESSNNSNSTMDNGDMYNSIDNKDYSNNNNDDDDTTMYLLKLAKACAKTNLPIASHDFLRSKEAIYNYGNIAFLHGFGYEWDEFVQLPSRKCVETEGEVEERQRLLNDVKKNAIMVQQQKQQKQEQRQSNNDNTNSTTIAGDDLSSSKYDNLIRVRKDGRKILLRGVNLWNVYDTTIQGTHDTLESIRSKIERGEITAIGQAVWICHVEYLD